MTLTPENIKELRASIPGSTVLTSESEGYGESIKRWSDAAEKKAAIVILPTTTKDISVAILFSQKYNLELAVSSGGHSCSGSSSTEGGLSLNLKQMRGVTVNAEEKYLDVQGGALWEEVDVAAGKFNLATVGGTVNHTGVAGLTLGGGYGWLTGWYGLTIDVLIEVEFVLADGKIVVCNKDQNADLFWAAKGAGQSFGVATRFRFTAFEQKSTVWAGNLVFGSDKLAEIVRFSNHVAEVSKGEVQIIMVFALPPPIGKPCVIATCYYNGPTEKALEFYKPLLELGPIVNECKEMPYSSVNGMLNSLSTYGDRKTQKGAALTTPLDILFAQSIFDNWFDFLIKVPDAAASVLLFEFMSFKESIKIPQDAQSFANRGEYFNLLINLRWTDPANDTVCREWARALAQNISDELKVTLKKKNLTTDVVGEYGNYDGIATSSAKKIFGSNFPKVLELKKKYDPANVFFKAVKII